MSATIDDLKRLAPGIDWHTDPDTGGVYASIDDMAITDPFRSECGRFTATPDRYGIPMSAALVMASHNLLCPTEFAS